MSEELKESGNAKDLAENILKEMPEPSLAAPQILAEENTPEPEPEPIPSTAPNTNTYAVTEPDDTIFDESRHLYTVDATGAKIPTRTKDGKRFRRKPGRKPGMQPEQVNAPVVSTAPVEAPEILAKKAAIETVNIIFIIGMAIGGEEWQPRVVQSTGLNEPEMMISAFTRYYLSTGVREVPPWLGVCIACGIYAAPRFTMPKTKTRMAAIWDKCKGMFAWVKGRR